MPDDRNCENEKVTQHEFHAVPRPSLGSGHVRQAPCTVQSPSLVSTSTLPRCLGHAYKSGDLGLHSGTCRMVQGCGS